MKKVGDNHKGRKYYYYTGKDFELVVFDDYQWGKPDSLWVTI
jgi:hypothetical protein